MESRGAKRLKGKTKRDAKQEVTRREASRRMVAAEEKVKMLEKKIRKGRSAGQQHGKGSGGKGGGGRGGGKGGSKGSKT